MSHYVYLDKREIPNVIVERDIGNPPAFIYELADLVRDEMESPNLRREYGLRSCITKLLMGVSGSGKSLCIAGLLRKIYEVVSEVTGVEIADLPKRVLRMRAATVLSHYLGQSDKRLDRFFTEAIEMADEVFVAPDGTEYHLPVIVIAEEVDALARHRGGDNDSVYDRILTTALERLDFTQGDYENRLILFLSTTNVPHLIDSAYLRRIGGTVEKFGRLTTRRGFSSVLEKQLARRRLQTNNGHTQDELVRNMAGAVSAWLYAPNDNGSPEAEVEIANSTAPTPLYMRDFLTGGLVDRAAEQAAEKAHRAHRQGCPSPGISHEMLMEAFEEQIRHIVDRLDRKNVTSYVDLPDGAHVTNVRRRAPQRTSESIQYRGMG